MAARASPSLLAILVLGCSSLPFNRCGEQSAAGLVTDFQARGPSREWCTVHLLIHQPRSACYTRSPTGAILCCRRRRARPCRRRRRSAACPLCVSLGLEGGNGAGGAAACICIRACGAVRASQGHSTTTTGVGHVTPSSRSTPPPACLPARLCPPHGARAGNPKCPGSRKPLPAATYKISLVPRGMPRSRRRQRPPALNLRRAAHQHTHPRPWRWPPAPCARRLERKRGAHAGRQPHRRLPL